MKHTLIVLNEMKEKGLFRDYAIGGAMAALRWTEPFFTQDLDIFIILQKEIREDEIINLSALYEYLKNKGYEWSGQWIIIEGIPVEFIPAEGLAKEAVEYGVDIEFEGVKTRVISPEYLIALFLSAGREKDKIKVRLLLDQADIDKEKLEIILRKYSLYNKFERFKDSG
jgi:predicted nucleotidyltransferase